MPSPVWGGFARKVIGTPYLCLKPHVHLADVVESREHREAGDKRLVEIVKAACCRKPFSDSGLAHQRFKTRTNVGEVVFEQMNAFGIFSVGFCPVVSSIRRAWLSFRHLGVPLLPHAEHLPMQEAVDAGRLRFPTQQSRRYP